MFRSVYRCLEVLRGVKRCLGCLEVCRVFRGLVAYGVVIEVGSG